MGQRQWDLAQVSGQSGLHNELQTSQDYTERLYLPGQERQGRGGEGVRGRGKKGGKEGGEEEREA